MLNLHKEGKEAFKFFAEMQEYGCPLDAAVYTSRSQVMPLQRSRMKLIGCYRKWKRKGYLMTAGLTMLS